MQAGSLGDKVIDRDRMVVESDLESHRWPDNQPEALRAHVFTLSYSFLGGVWSSRALGLSSQSPFGLSLQGRPVVGGPVSSEPQKFDRIAYIDLFVRVGRCGQGL